MKTTKVLLGSLVLAGMVSACTNEEIIDVAQNEVAQSGRTQLDLTLDAGVESRMSNGSSLQSLFTANDVLGAVLVDGGYDATLTNQVDWTVQNGHVGNNKWAFNAESGKFETAGTTAVGAWLFYTKYNEKMTTTRNGVEFYFPQIQEGAADFKYLENNNINFKITPILNIDGYEGEKMNLTLQYASVYNYLNLKLDFDAATNVEKVQKIIVKAKDVNGVAVSFPTESKIVNTNVPAANLSLNGLNPAVLVPNHVNPSTTGRNLADQNEEIRLKYQELRYNDVDWTQPIVYNPIVATANAAANKEYLVVDCDPTNHSDAAGQGGTVIDKTTGQFSVYMLMPAGVYSEITLDIYTNNGVYTKTVDSRNYYKENEASLPANWKVGENEIFLRSNKVTVLGDVEGHTTTATDADYQKSDYLKIVASDINTTNDRIIAKTADLINLINGITASGTQQVKVAAQNQIGGSNPADDDPIAAHKVVINKAVMEAIVKKEAAVGDIQLVFSGAQMTIKGEASENAKLKVHDLTFNDGAEIVSGYVKTTSDFVVTNNSSLYVNGGCDVEFGYANGYDNDEIHRVVVSNGAKASVSKNLAHEASIDEVHNMGTFTLNVGTELDNVKFENDNLIVVNGTLNSDEILNDAPGLTLYGVTPTLENNGTINVLNGSNNGKIINKVAESKIAISGEFDNIKNIENNGLILVETAVPGTPAKLNNDVNAVITNNADMYCYGGDNTINNIGTIYANGLLSTTYITTNSAADELTTPTNGTAQIMGTIVIENRDQDVSVTTATQKGYIQYTVKDADLTNGLLKKVTGDKFNKIILQSTIVSLNSDLNSYLKYVKVNAASKLTLAASMKLNEVEFAKNTTLLAAVTNAATATTGNYNDVTIAKMVVNQGVTVKLPTENALNVQELTKSNSMTSVEIDNKGTVLVGGDFWTINTLANSGSGNFASGDGNSTAFHWGKAANDHTL